MKKVCAIYTRKSSDEGLDMDFNTLDAQRESCEAYIKSQKSEGWVLSPKQYNDGGFSGGSLDRPALKELLDDIKANKIQVVILYKIDRLTRSLMDFSKLIEIFDAHNVTFVSVTQSFNTTSSMGRLTLNILLSFAQFEREISGERIRDKISASKAKGMWMGGSPPLGYDIQDRQLVIDTDEAKTVKYIFDHYLKLGRVQKLKKHLDQNNIISPIRTSKTGRTHGGTKFSRGALYAILKNPVYIGKIQHKSVIHEGLHDGIVDDHQWNKVQEKLKEQATEKQTHAKRRNMLQGLLYDMEGTLYTPTYTKKHDRQYRYYISQNLQQYQDHPHGIMARLPAHEIEALVETSIRKNIEEICKDLEHHIITYVVKNQNAISSFDLVRQCVTKVTISMDQITVSINPLKLTPLLKKHLNIDVNIGQKALDIAEPYQTRRAQKGAVIIESSKKKDALDLPPDKLKKLIQGIIWRDEHFAGASMSDIAQRENCSDSYVRKTIVYSFDTLENI